MKVKLTYLIYLNYMYATLHTNSLSTALVAPFQCNGTVNLTTI